MACIFDAIVHVLFTDKIFSLYKHLLLICCCVLVCLYHVTLVVLYNITCFVEYSILQPFGRNPYSQINSTERDPVTCIPSEHGRKPRRERLQNVVNEKGKLSESLLDHLE